MPSASYLPSKYFIHKANVATDNVKMTTPLLCLGDCKNWACGHIKFYADYSLGHKISTCLLK